MKSSSPRNRPLWTLVAFLLLLGIDQWSKAWCRGNLSLHQSTNEPWPGVFEITLAYNKGIAFGLFQGSGVLFAPLAFLITVFALRHSFKHPGDWKLMHAAMALIASGAVGNLIDRVWLGKVTDMFWFRLIDFPVFNWADSCICVGAVFLGIRMVFDSPGEQKIMDKIEVVPEGTQPENPISN